MAAQGRIVKLEDLPGPSGAALNSKLLEGMLADGEDFETVVATDYATLETLGLTYETLASKLEQPLEVAGHSGAVIADLQVNVTQYRGQHPCPWCGFCGSGSKDVTLTNRTTGEKLQTGDLLVHLIREHHFCEGSTPYRLDPAVFARITGLV